MEITYIEAFNILEAFREELKSAIKHDLYVTLDTESCKEILDALDTVDY